MFYKIGALKDFSNSKETPAQVFYCKFYEIFKKTFFLEHIWVITSGYNSFTWRFALLQIYCMVSRTVFLKRTLGNHACSCACSLVGEVNFRFLKQFSKAHECFFRKGTTFHWLKVLITFTKFFYSVFKILQEFDKCFILNHCISDVKLVKFTAF